jgi:hypothetical protein
VKGVVQEGGLEKGYGLLTVTTTVGTDLCFAAYRPGSYSAGGLQTNALQAFVQMNGQDPQALYLGGGKILKVGNASITRSDPGLAYVEKIKSGVYVVANPSSTDAGITVKLPALKDLKAFQLDDKGNRAGDAAITKADNSISVQLKANEKVEFGL